MLTTRTRFGLNSIPVPQSDQANPTPPPRAFTQGAGLVLQIVGGTLFLVSFFICCGSSLFSKDWATKTDLTHIGWHLASDPADRPTYSAQKALTISLFASVFFGLALAATGLGMQSEHGRAPVMAVVVSIVAVAFAAVQLIFCWQMQFVLFAFVAAAMLLVFIGMAGLSIHALKEMRHNPPPAGHDVLPGDYKIPYSHYHDDPPEVRLEREINQRRERLAVEQKQVEMLEERLRKRLEERE
jgi:lysylphosphatidylglycerol synthetase-like protein (DUF2156 family)